MNGVIVYMWEEGREMIEILGFVKCFEVENLKKFSE